MGLAAIAYGSVLMLRGWRGLDQVASDPGYNWIEERMQGGWSIFKLRPYLHLDSPLIASVVSSLPREWHGLAVTLTAHTTWLVCALTIFTVLRSRAFSAVASLIGGLLLVTSPWAAQSAIGNYGNIRWPILVAASVVIASEVAYKRPRVLPMTLATVAAILSNPVHPLLLAPFIAGWWYLATEHRRGLLLASSPLVLGFVVNLLNADAGGHDEKIKAFWEGAGLFWVSGQLLPALVALAGLIFSAKNLRALNERRFFAVNLFAMVLLIAAASYQLGGIADRYYVAPAALAAIATLVSLTNLRTRSAKLGKVIAVALTVVLAVPTARWFFVFPYLRSAEGWSTQVERVREQCSTGEISSFELVTSSGQSRTDPISCDDL
jgi:hypothetical protein